MIDQTIRSAGLPVDAELRTELILRVVEAVPAGQATNYGQVAAVIGVGARQVGRVLADCGDTVAWWRVVNSQGSLPAALLPRAMPHWLAEGLVAPGDERINLTTKRVAEEILHQACATACSALGVAFRNE